MKGGALILVDCTSFFLLCHSDVTMTENNKSSVLLRVYNKIKPPFIRVIFAFNGCKTNFLYDTMTDLKTTFPIRAFKLLGVETLIVTNAAGSLADGLRPGDIMIIKDHINFPDGLVGLNPLCGPNDEKFGPRFPAMSGCYDKGLRCLAMEIAKELGVANLTQEGVYAMVGGPNFESIAEARLLLHRLGVDAVGMSTAPEVVVATHCGLRVFGLSLITNKVVKSYEDSETVNHEGVLEVGRMRSQTVQQLVTELVSRMEINNNNTTNSAV
ncbi:hypothetical protein L3Q82_007556 [Scortum barcoo]|uniref:Uncharacterized protein n=1 Tax=Scortum barcoo TaxID=214431 RepID=A0ACB8WNA4_9TELE|nr:hypothetical protein L3Q82_007556 [Scortum barcoo]